MAKFNIEHDFNGIEGLCVIEPTIHEDNRGFLFEAYNERELEVLNKHFVQDNEVHSKEGVLRGFGVSIKYPQARLIRVLRGKIYDVVIDLRKESRTFMQWSSIELSGENRKQIYIPERLAHAYLALEEADVFFKVSTYFVPGNEIGFLWNSKSFNIIWPLNKNLILSEKDKNNPEFVASILE